MITKELALRKIAKYLKAFKTFDDLREVESLFRSRWSVVKQRRVTQAMKSGLAIPGSKVRFSGRNGVMLKGMVEKVNRTTVVVRVDNGVRWKVSPGLLKSA